MIGALARIIGTGYVERFDPSYANGRARQPKPKWMTTKTELAKRFMMAAEEADKNGPFIIDY